MPKINDIDKSTKALEAERILNRTLFWEIGGYWEKDIHTKDELEWAKSQRKGWPDKWFFFKIEDSWRQVNYL